MGLYFQMISSYFHVKQSLFAQLRPWIICVFSSLFFLYEFIQVNIFDSINTAVVHAYSLSPIGIGFLSSAYFYSTVLFLLPAGQILDRYSPKRTILVTMVLCILGIMGFAYTSNIIIAIICRLLEGIGSAFCFLGAFKIASNWIPRKKLTLASSLIMTIGIFGGVIAQTPIAMLVNQFGWRQTLYMNAFLGLLVFIIICLGLSDRPKMLSDTGHSKSRIPYWASMRTAYLTRHNWSCGIYTCLMNSPLAVLGALWGNVYLKRVHHFSLEQSSLIISMLFIGTIVGAPICGYISGISKKKKVVLLLGSTTSGLILSFILLFPSTGFELMLVLFFLLGLFTSTQVLGYPVAAQNGPKSLSAMSASVVSFSTMSGYIFFQPLIGKIMSFSNKTQLYDDNLVSSLAAYQYAIFFLVVMVSLAACVVVFIKEHPGLSEPMKEQY